MINVREPIAYVMSNRNAASLAMPYMSDNSLNFPTERDTGGRSQRLSPVLSFAELEVRQFFDGVVMGIVDAVTIDESLDVLNELITSDQGGDDSIPSGSTEVDDIDDVPPPIQTSAQSVSFLPGGGYVLTWSQQNDGPANWDVYAQVFGSNGSPAGQAFRVNQFTAGD
ncbi:MAG TPA: hypothetical protein PKD54_07150, partial [Pirellulaceae bacterium]|nr:hypothetical protein [Pirellulaceae bacterium]